LGIAGRRETASFDLLGRFTWLVRVTTGHMDDYSVDATELVETYGWFLLSRSAVSYVPS
jgi:hypothetical protein